jgi:hypothetical protein
MHPITRDDPDFVVASVAAIPGHPRAVVCLMLMTWTIESISWKSSIDLRKRFLQHFYITKDKANLFTAQCADFRSQRIWNWPSKSMLPIMRILVLNSNAVSWRYPWQNRKLVIKKTLQKTILASEYQIKERPSASAKQAKYQRLLAVESKARHAKRQRLGRTCPSMRIQSSVFASGICCQQLGFANLSTCYSSIFDSAW